MNAAWNPRGTSVAMTRLLLDAGADVNLKNDKSETVFDIKYSKTPMYNELEFRKFYDEKMAMLEKYKHRLKKAKKKSP